MTESRTDPLVILIVDRDPIDGAAIVKTGDSTIRVEEVQYEGEASGAPRWRIGTRLGVETIKVLLSMKAALSEIERAMGAATVTGGEQYGAG